MTELGDLLKDMADLDNQMTQNIRFLFEVVKTLAEENNELRARLWNLERRINRMEIR